MGGVSVSLCVYTCAGAYWSEHMMELWEIPPRLCKLPLSSFCTCSALLGQGAEGPPAWAHGPGVLAFSGPLFPAPPVQGRRPGAGTAASSGTIVAFEAAGAVQA